METSSQSNSWTPKQAIILAVICFVLGSAIGYFGHAPVTPKVATAVPAEVSQPNPVSEAKVAPALPEKVSPEQLKAASVKAAGSVLEKLKSDPKNFKLLVQAGEMYYHHGSFAEAGSYYNRALAVQDDVALRNRYASALFYAGDADGALKQYEKVLSKQPKNDIALFNQGMILYKAKNDRTGAVDSWKKLLAAFPNHPQRDQVQKMIDVASKQS